MNIDRIVLTTFPGYFFTQILCLRSIQQYAAGFPIDVIIDDLGNQNWTTYPADCKEYILQNFPDLDITFHLFSDFAGIEKVKTGGWFRQQLVKLYLDQFVTGDRWLLVDADVVFTEPLRINLVSASIRNEATPVDIGNRMYVKYMLDCDKPWVVNESEYWCLSGVPFRLIPRDLLENLRTQIESVHKVPLLDLHLQLFDDNKLVAFDPNGKTMVMSEFQLIEVYRHRYYHTPLPIGRCTASNFDHTSLKDWKFDRSWFEHRNIPITEQHWQTSQTFGNTHV